MMKGSRRVKAGSGTVTAADMVDSSALLQSGQLEAAQQRLAKDGYLLLRGYLPAARVSMVGPSCLLPEVCLRLAHLFNNW